MSPERKALQKRVESLRSAGLSFPAIASQLGISAARAQHIYWYRRDGRPERPNFRRCEAVRSDHALGQLSRDELAIAHGLSRQTVDLVLDGRRCDPPSLEHYRAAEAIEPGSGRALFDRYTAIEEK